MPITLQFFPAEKKLGKVCGNNAHHLQIAQNTLPLRTGSRLLIRDPLTQLRFLIDTGADLSALPKSETTQQTPDDLFLYAANGTRIETFG